MPAIEEQVLRFSFLIVLVALGILILRSKWSPFKGSSESAKYALDKINTYRKGHQEFRTLDQWFESGVPGPVPGNLIECKRYRGLYDHWGIYVDENLEDFRLGKVIHLIPNGEFGPEIKIDTLKQMVRSSECRVNDLEWLAQEKGLDLRSKEDVIKHASTELEKFKANEKPSYDLLEFNCEHFVTLCAFGSPFSLQAENLQDTHWPKEIAKKVSDRVHFKYD